MARCAPGHVSADRSNDVGPAGERRPNAARSGLTWIWSVFDFSAVQPDGRAQRNGFHAAFLGLRCKRTSNPPLSQGFAKRFAVAGERAE